MQRLREADTQQPAQLLSTVQRVHLQWCSGQQRVRGYTAAGTSLSQQGPLFFSMQALQVTKSKIPSKPPVGYCSRLVHWDQNSGSTFRRKHHCTVDSCHTPHNHASSRGEWKPAACSETM
eukprot:1160422-Pelagomonas_calceolata.AAC.12